MNQEQLVARTVHKGYVNCNDKRNKPIRISNNDNSSSSQYCAGRRLTLHIRTLEVRPES